MRKLLLLILREEVPFTRACFALAVMLLAIGVVRWAVEAILSLF
jgi:hypothetical protein